MTLYLGQSNYSTWSWRPWLVLRAAGVAIHVERVLVGGASARNPALRNVSPSGLVPALRLADGSVLWDSLAITEWAAEQAAPGAVWPIDAAARAHARCVTAEMHAGFSALRNGLPGNVRMRLTGKPLDAAVARDVARISELWAEARARFGEPSGGGPYLYGAWSAADAFYAPVVSRFVTYNVALEGAAAAYAAAVWAHPLVQEWCAAAAAEGEEQRLAHYETAAVEAGGAPRDWRCVIEGA